MVDLHESKIVTFAPEPVRQKPIVSTFSEPYLSMPSERQDQPLSSQSRTLLLPSGSVLMTKITITFSANLILVPSKLSSSILPHPPCGKSVRATSSIISSMPELFTSSSKYGRFQMINSASSGIGKSSPNSAS